MFRFFLMTGGVMKNLSWKWLSILSHIFESLLEIRFLNKKVFFKNNDRSRGKEQRIQTKLMTDY